MTEKGAWRSSTEIWRENGWRREDDDGSGEGMGVGGTAGGERPRPPPPRGEETTKWAPTLENFFLGVVMAEGRGRRRKKEEEEEDLWLAVLGILLVLVAAACYSGRRR